jgi:DNA-damage-inducible protein D
MKKATNLIVFQNKEIRRVWYMKEWYFSVIDVVSVLTDSNKPNKYWSAMKVRVRNEDGAQLSTICRQLKLKSKDDKMYKTDCSNTKGLLRIIQSIPSPKAEPFKMWLAQVGKEHLDEIENPELAQERMKFIYEKKGYPKDWIDKRLRGLAIRQKRTNFNLRDNMTDLELIFTMLGERVTTEISKNEKPIDFKENKKVANRGGSVAGRARKETEKEIGKSVITRKNYLYETKSNKRLNK